MTRTSRETDSAHTSRYRLLEPLGQGGMGEVFLAEDTQLGRKVAIKFVSEAAGSDERALERLYREARSAAALDHPFICKIYEIADIDGCTGIVMEHVTGETLQAVLARASLAPKRALEIAGEIAEALEEAHQKRVLHRDLKPANVMLTGQGHVKVMDFGLAKPLEPSAGEETATAQPLTDPGVRVGTPGYMAPEQLLAGHVDERSDIFAFGVLLYELLAGVHPFQRASPSGTMAAILRESHTPIMKHAADLPRTTAGLLDRLLSKAPEDRYPSFGDVRRDLRQVLDESSGASPAVVPSEGPTAGHRIPFVAREREHAEARRLLGRAVGGEGSVLLIGGEPGIGKTRLAEEILREAREQGCLALTGRCYELEGTPPFIPWVEIVERAASIVPRTAFREALGDAAPEVAKLVPEMRRLFPDIPPPMELPPEHQQRYLFNGFLEFTRRGTRVSPQVLLLDDLHWADDSTLLLLQHVAQHVSELPLLIVGTYRDVDLDVQRPFAEMLETLTRTRSAQKLALGRFDQAGVSAMLEALSGQTPPADLVPVIYSETEGNPFFTEEVFQHLSEEGRLFDEQGAWRSDLRVGDLAVPEGVRLVIGRRVKRLSENARRVLTSAAVAGRSFDERLLDALGDVEGDALLAALEEAEGAKLILPVASGRDVRWEFAHGLIRQTLEASLSLMRRQRAHLRVAEALERVHGSAGERHAADIAQHLYQAGVGADPEKTVRFLTLAGDQALGAGAFDEALRHFDDALPIQADEGTDHGLATLRHKKGAALRSLGRGTDAVEEWQNALNVFERLGDGEGIARTVFDAGSTLIWRVQAHEAQVLARRGLDALEPGLDVERCRLLSTLCWAASWAGDDFRVAHDAIEDAQAIAETLDLPELTADVLQARAWFHFCYMQFSQAAEAGARAAEQSRALGKLWDVGEVSMAFVLPIMYQGQFDDVLETCEELDDLAAAVGHVDARWIVKWCRTWHHLVTTNNQAESKAVTRHYLDWATEANIAWLGFCHFLDGWSSFLVGDWAQAQSAFQSADRWIPSESFFGEMSPSAELLARAYAADSDAVEPVQAYARRIVASDGDHKIGFWQMIPNVTEALAVMGHAEMAAQCYTSVCQALQRGGLVTLSLRLWQMVAGIAAGAGKHWETGQEHFETALRQAHELPNVVGQPEVRRWYAQMLVDRDAPGDRDKARTLLGEATEMYRTSGMPKHFEMVEKMSADL